MATPRPSIQIEGDRATISDPSGSLKLGLRFEGRCVVDQLTVNGTDVPLGAGAIGSGVKSGGSWHRSSEPSGRTVLATTKGQALVLEPIRFGEVSETWTLWPTKQGIAWQIDRKYLADQEIQDVAMPGWNFKGLDTWSGALLGTGGVAWCKLFDRPTATYGVHTNYATLWNPLTDQALFVHADIKEVTPPPLFGTPVPEPRSTANATLGFTRQPDDSFSMLVQATPAPNQTRVRNARFLRDSPDVWKPQRVRAGQTVSVRLILRAEKYGETYNRGNLKRIDQAALTEMMNTIGRLGVIDQDIIGTNGWYSGYAVLHEPWISLMGLAIDDPRYTANMASALAYQSQHAVQEGGLVKSRWAYAPGDEQPGTYDEHGFYECQWGRLMDTQPSFVINVAEQADLSGAIGVNKARCEAALDYLLRTDKDRDGLVEMKNRWAKQHKASDWLDVIWASHESAFVNAQMYRALTLWAEIEARLKDLPRAEQYLAAAAKLKARFNRPTSEGGFWDEGRGWYAYWREQDGTVRGNNLVLPVNFMAIGYGVCDDPHRIARVLDKVEREMVKQKLFCWPVNIYPFTAEETNNQPFPTYENGDIFLAWAELGIRCYARYKPPIALKYVRNVLAQYRKNGLAFQRYLRKSQQGAGDDILANNASAIVGLYRDIYGIQPKINRIYLEPHLVPELEGTVVKCRLRKRFPEITLGRKIVARFKDSSLKAVAPFGVAFDEGRIQYFRGDESDPHINFKTGAPLTVEVMGDGWKLKSAVATEVAHSVHQLEPRTTYEVVSVPGSRLRVRANGSGVAEFKILLSAGRPVRVSLEPFRVP